MQAKRFQHGSIMVSERKRGPDVVFFRYVQDGHFRSEALGTVLDLPTVAGREQAATKVRLRINDPAVVRGQLPLTVDGLFQMFDDKHIKVRCRKLTASTYRSLYNTHIKPTWSGVLLRDVHTPAVRAWLEALSVSIPVKGHVRGLLHALFEYACGNELLDRNPVDRVRQSRQRLKVPAILSPEEVRLILAQLREPVRTLATVVAGLGLRISEALGLQWGDIDWEQLIVTVQRSWSEGEANGTKTTGSAAALPLSAVLAETLLRHRGQVALDKNEDFIFGGPNGTPPWPDSLLVHHLRPAAVRAGVTKAVGWHTFRRTYATLLHGLGAPVRVQMELLRHSDSRTTLNVYAQAIGADKREAADKMAEMLLNG